MADNDWPVAERGSCSPVWNQKTWAAHTQDHLSSSRTLRMELMAAKTEDVVPTTKVEQKFQSPVASRPCGTLTRYFEDKRKQRLQQEENIAKTLADRMQIIEAACYALKVSKRDLQQLSTKIWGSLNVAEKRLELRSKRPDGENFRDYLQDALEQERSELIAAHAQLQERLLLGEHIQAAVNEARETMHQNKLTLHVDRTTYPQELFGKASTLDKQTAAFCKETAALLKAVEETMKNAQWRTSANIKKRITETTVLRKRLEKEVLEIRYAMSEADIELDKKRRVIEERRNAPENQMGDSKLDLEKFYKNALLDSATLSKVRAKIKAAAYTGSQGRQLDIIFMRFDRDGTGNLDEDEVRAALRRTLKIPPSTISDAEVSALCSTLDGDNSGAVSISEIVDFLNADVDLCAMEEKWAKGMETREKLRQHSNVLVDNLRLKANAWKLERECLNISLTKSLELDGLPPLVQGASKSKRNKPLEPRVVEKVRSKLRQAAQDSGTTVEQCFARFDGDGSGQLEVEEVHRAIRQKLKIPSYAISDAEVISLCEMLDKDASGSVGIDELVEFVNPTEREERAKGESQKLESIKKVKTTSKWVPKPTVALIEKIRTQLRRAAKEVPEGQTLDDMLSTFDLDFSGQLDVDEVRKTLRSTLKIGKESVSDQEIASLCVMLDKDGSGSVGIDELKMFISSAPKLQKAGLREEQTKHRLEQIKAGRGNQQAVKPPNSARQKQRPAPADAALYLPPASVGSETAR